MLKPTVLLFVALAPLATGSAKLLADDASTASDLRVAYANRPTNVNTVHRFAEAPPTFDPINASDDDLARYGFPARPDPQAEPEHYAVWKRAMQAAKTRWHGDLGVVPTEKLPSDSQSMRVEPDSSAKTTSAPSASTTINWAGVVLTKNLNVYTSQQSFRDIYSLITVPTGQPPFNGGCNFYDQLTFAGLDGYVKNYQIQPGPNRGTLMGGLWSATECNRTNTEYFAVFGWIPAAMQTAFTVNPGDMLYTEVGAPKNGVLPSYLFIEDLTTLTYDAYSVSIPYGYEYVGSSAEWVVSRHCCRTDGYPYPLLNTIAIFFDGGAALDNAGNTLYPGSQASTTKVLTMRDDLSDQTIETVEQGSSGYEGNHGLLLQTANCAFAGGCTQQ